jgi:hypothetical protein
MAAAISGTDIRPADLSVAQYRKSRRAKVREAFEERWKRKWGKYQSTLTYRTTAQAEPWSKKVFKRHAKLTKVESTINTLLRTEHIGLNRYLYHRKVPGHPTPACLYSHDQQSTMHVVVFCPRHAASRAEIYRRAGTSLYRELLAKLKAAKAVADWFMQTNLLLYLLPARELTRTMGGGQEVL